MLIDNRRRLPPLDSLIAFDAAARHLSFTRAADELSVTQAAISRRIRELEKNLGVRLFTRAHRAVQLTPEGTDYQHTVAMALGHLANASDQLRAAPDGARLTVAADQSVTALWLMPRLPRFRHACPDVRIRLVASDVDADCLADPVDVAIVHGDGAWPGWRGRMLFEDEIFPVCSPDYARRLGNAPTAAALADAMLIDLEDDHWHWLTWRMWFTENGIDLPAGAQGLRINSYPMVVRAARDGQGVALGWRHLVDDALATGDLVRPVAASARTAYGYHLMMRADREPGREARAFRDWVLGERDRGEPAHATPCRPAAL